MYNNWVTYRLVLIDRILVYKAKVSKVVLGKFIMVFIRVLKVVLGIQKHQKHSNAGGTNDISPWVSETLDSLKNTLRQKIQITFQ